MTAATAEVSLVVCGVSGQTFGIPLGRVRQILRMVAVTPIPETPEWLLGVVNVRGNHMTVIELATRLGIPSSLPNMNSRIVVVETKDVFTGLVVDDVVDVMTGESDQTPDQIVQLRGDGHPAVAVARVGSATLIVLDVDEVCSGSNELDLPEDLAGVL